MLPEYLNIMGSKTRCRELKMGGDSTENLGTGFRYSFFCPRLLSVVRYGKKQLWRKTKGGGLEELHYIIICFGGRVERAWGGRCTIDTLSSLIYFFKLEVTSLFCFAFCFCFLFPKESQVAEHLVLLLHCFGDEVREA